MKYSKPKIVAQNSKQGVYAAGCPAQHIGMCKSCERTQ